MKDPAGEITSGGPNNGLVLALKEKAPRVAVALAASQAALPVARKIRTWIKQRSTYVITVGGDDTVYRDLHEWVLDQMPPDQRRSLFAYSGEGTHHGEILAKSSSPGVIEIETPQRKPAPRIRFRYDGNRTHTLRFDGHRVQVAMTEPEGAREGGVYYVIQPPKLVFTASSTAGRDAVEAKLNELLQLRHDEKHQPSLRIGKPWGDWHRLDDLPRRSLESVVLPDEQSSRLVADVERFLLAEADYNRRFIPWHRGYLFEGPPGTGKTSIAKALANHFRMDVWYLSLGDLRSGSTLMNLIGNVAPRSMLLLEDIDVFHAATTRDDESDVTLSDLLNALDGIATPHGLITVMTSNTPDVLDPALIRPGRVDMVEHFGLADQAQIERIYEWFYGIPWPRRVRVTGLHSPAAVVGVMHQMPEHPVTAASAISELESA